MATEETKLAVMQTSLDYIGKKVDSIDAKVSNNYVTLDQFKPVRLIAYGMVSIMAMAMVGVLAWSITTLVKSH